MAAVAVICGRNRGLTLGPIVACYNEPRPLEMALATGGASGVGRWKGTSGGSGIGAWHGPLVQV